MTFDIRSKRGHCHERLHHHQHVDLSRGEFDNRWMKPPAAVKVPYRNMFRSAARCAPISEKVNVSDALRLPNERWDCAKRPRDGHVLCVRRI
jgi:hypothetical protein